MNEENDILISQSLPLQSYEIITEPERVIFKHPESYRPRFQVRPWYWVCGWLLLTIVDTVTVCKVDDRRAEI